MLVELSVDWAEMPGGTAPSTSSTTELESLFSWLRAAYLSDVVIQRAPRQSDPHHLGDPSLALQLIFSSSMTTACASCIVAWIKSRSRKVTIRLAKKDGTTVHVSAAKPIDAIGILEQLGELREGKPK